MDDGFAYYPITVQYELITSANAGSRAVFYVVLDANGVQVATQPVTTTVAANDDKVFAWNITTGAGYSDAAAHFAAPLPPLVIYPGMTFGVQVNGGLAGDIGTLSANVMKLSTQPTSAPAPALVPTPIMF